MNSQILSVYAGWLIDGSGDAFQSKLKLDMVDGTIQSIRKISDPVPDSAKLDIPVLDLSDCTLLPGLIDCHVHLAMSPTACLSSSTGPAGEAPNRYNGRILTHLDQLLAKGVMAVRDGGDPHGSVLLYKEKSGTQDHPVHLCAAGKARHRAGRYGHLIGCALSPDRTLAGTIFQEKKSVDHIKIINSGLNSLTVFAKETAPQFNSAELRAAVGAARQRGFKTMVHANGKVPVKLAVEAGCDSIEHGFFMGRENLHRMASRETTWVPTAFTMKALGRRSERAEIDTGVVQKNLEHQIRQIQAAHELGVRIALGTDSGSAGVEHGQALIEEMRLFMDAGYSIEKIVQCATHNGALLLGLPQVGQLKVNMQATFIAVKGAPSQLPESLNRIKLIIFKGNKINKKSYKLK